MQADGPMTEASDFHAACAVLGLSHAPSASEAKTAFRVRAALLHPDVHQSGGEVRMQAATDAMQQLNDAYQLVLASLEGGDAKPILPGHRERRSSRVTRSSSRGSLRPGREIVAVKRRTTRQRTEPLGRLAHLSLFLGG